jgi:hypothetical protein
MRWAINVVKMSVEIGKVEFNDGLKTLKWTVENALIWSEYTAVLLGTIDYWCETDDLLPVSASCVTTLNPRSFSSSETMVNPGIRSWKRHLSEWARRQKAVGDIYLKNKWRAQTLQPWFRIWHFQIPAWKRCLQMHFLAVRFVFWGPWSWFLKQGVKIYLMAPLSPVNSPTCDLS